MMHLSYVGIQDSKVCHLPFLLLPRVQLFSKLSEHAARIPSSSQLWVAEDARNAMTDNFFYWFVLSLDEGTLSV